MKQAHVTRALVAISLGVGTALTAGSMALMPDFSGSTEAWLAAIAASGTATVSTVGFVSAQVFLAVGYAGVAHLLRSRTSVLAPLAGALLVLSCFGHAVWGGVNLLMLPMAGDPANYAAYAQLLDRARSTGAVFPFMALGTLAMVIGYVLLGVALIRSKSAPLWLGIALIAWVPLEFAGSMLGPWMAYASGLVFVGVFGVLTVVLLRSSVGHWQTAIEAERVSELPQRGARGPGIGK